MVEILAVLMVMGILSLTAVSGVVMAQRRQAAVDVIDLVNKTVAGILTSHVLENLAQEYDGDVGGLIELGEALPVSLYISNVNRLERGSQEADLYGLEAFQASMGTVISAHALSNGQGVMVKLNQFSTKICEHVLSEGLSYEGVVNLNGDTDVVYRREDLKDNPELLAQVCQSAEENEAGLKNILDLGVIFNNLGAGRWDVEPDCGKCTVAVAGFCMLIETPECEGEGCDRKYFDTQQCAWVCYDGQGDSCECPNNRPIWFTEKQVCVRCLTNADCPEETPLCMNPGKRDSSCNACSPETLYNEATQTCEDCVSLTDGERPIYHDGTCVECLENTDCPSEKPRCDTMTYTCMECVTDADCPVNSPGCDLVSHTCKVCPDGTIWNGKLCQEYTGECIDNSGCPAGKFCLVSATTVNLNKEGACYKNVTGKCQDVGEKTAYNVDGIGIVYQSVKIIKTWWSALNWCRAQGMRPLEIADLGCNNVNKTKSFNCLPTDKFTALKSINYYNWLADPVQISNGVDSTCTSFHLNGSRINGEYQIGKCTWGRNATAPRSYEEHRALCVEQ